VGGGKGESLLRDPQTSSDDVRGSIPCQMFSETAVYGEGQACRFVLGLPWRQ
jgi:hypothetical protein